jgi:hypothetical protein
MRTLALASPAAVPSLGGFAAQAAPVLVAVLLAALLLVAIEIRFGTSPTDWGTIGDVGISAD